MFAKKEGVWHLVDPQSGRLICDEESEAAGMRPILPGEAVLCGVCQLVLPAAGMAATMERREALKATRRNQPRSSQARPNRRRLSTNLSIGATHLLFEKY